MLKNPFELFEFFCYQNKNEVMNKTWTGDKELTIIIIEPIGKK
jgi:hypothetical protein